MAASVRSVGTALATTCSTGASSTVSLPAGVQENDILLMFVAVGSTTLHQTTPSGYTYLDGLYGQPGPSDISLSIYWKRAGTSESNPTVNRGNGAWDSRPIFVQMMAIQGCPTTGDPWDGDGSGGNSSYIPSITTVADDDLVVGAIATAYGQFPNNFSAWTNSNLTGITEWMDDGYFTGGRYAILGVVTGVKATAGSTGTTTYTPALGNYSAAQFQIGFKAGVAPPTTVTLTGAMTVTALAAIPGSVGAPPTIIDAPLMTAYALLVAPTAGSKLTIVAPTMYMYQTDKFWPPTVITTKQTVLPPVMAATANALTPIPASRVTITVPYPMNRPPEFNWADDVNQARFRWAYDTPAYLLIRVEAPTAVGDGRFLLPFQVSIEAEVASAVRSFPSPTVSVAPDYPYATTSEASGYMPTPRRFGPPSPSIYKEMVARVSPANIANFSMDEHTGNAIIVGDPSGKSMVFDGIDDYFPIEVPAHREHTMVLWFVCDPTDTGVSMLWQQAIPEGFGNLLYLGVSDGSLALNSTADLHIAGPYVRDGLPHMVMLTSRVRIESDHPVADEIKMYCDGVLVGADDWIVQWVGGSLGYLLKGRIDEVTFWDAPLQPEWATELWWQGIGEGGPPTSVTCSTAPSTSRMPVPTPTIRPMLDSWQIHDDFEGDELDPNLWVTGYQGFLQAEGAGGPAPSGPLDGVPFILDGEMTLYAGTIVQTRDWFSFGEWAFRIEMDEIPSDSEVIVGIAVFAAYADVEPMYESGAYYKTHYEEQMSWNCYISSNGRRYTYRGWSVYSPMWDDASGYELNSYNPDEDTVAIITSPHLRSGQNIHHSDSADFNSAQAVGSGNVPYWPMEGPYNNPYEARYLRLVIQVTGPPGSSLVITGINIVPPATKIVIPTAHLAADVETIVDHTFPRSYEGVKGPRSIKAPVLRTTSRFLRPYERASMLVEAPLRVEWADFLFPEWAGDARPVSSLSPSASALTLFIPPILFGEPVDVVIEATTASVSARAYPPNTSGTIKKAFGITRSETRKMAIRIYHHEMDLGIGMRELVSP